MTLTDSGAATGRVVVTDASVWAALLFQESRADEAAGLLEGLDLLAPHLLFYELANIARTKHMRGQVQEAVLTNALESALSPGSGWQG